MKQIKGKRSWKNSREESKSDTATVQNIFHSTPFYTDFKNQNGCIINFIYYLN